MTILQGPQNPRRCDIFVVIGVLEHLTPGRSLPCSGHHHGTKNCRRLLPARRPARAGFLA
jgi:hypothetical protein